MVNAGPSKRDVGFGEGGNRQGRHGREIYTSLSAGRAVVMWGVAEPAERRYRLSDLLDSSNCGLARSCFQPMCSGIGGPARADPLGRVMPPPEPRRPSLSISLIERTGTLFLPEGAVRKRHASVTSHTRRWNQANAAQSADMQEESVSAQPPWPSHQVGY